jgi:hypothetical protein
MGRLLLVVRVLAVLLLCESGSSENLVYVYSAADVAQDVDTLSGCYQENSGTDVLPWAKEVKDGNQNMADIYIHRALLDHPLRTRDPSKASIFYIPLQLVLSARSGVCNGMTHQERIDYILEGLTRGSGAAYFNRWGGSDHFITCSWWKCKTLLNDMQRTVLARTAVAQLEYNVFWSQWACPGRIIVIPYVHNSDILVNGANSLPPPSERSHSFFFVGSARRDGKRQHLLSLNDLYDDAFIIVAGANLKKTQGKWTMSSSSYGKEILNSRVCFCPSGDTPTSRRIFDAVAAGCIPAITSLELSALPFGSQIDYASFVLIGPDKAFDTNAGVISWANEIASLSVEDISRLWDALIANRQRLVYFLGSSEKPWRDLAASQEVVDALLYDVRALAAPGKRWLCNGGAQPIQSVDWGEKTLPSKSSWHLASAMKVYPNQGAQHEWLANHEALLIPEHKVLICAPRGNAHNFVRHLVYMIQGLQNAGELPLLPVSDKEYLREVYGSDWVRVAVVRDPVTRLESEYARLEADVGEGSTKFPSFHSFLDLIRLELHRGGERVRSLAPQSHLCGMKYFRPSAFVRYENLLSDLGEVLASVGVVQSPKSVQELVRSQHDAQSLKHQQSLEADLGKDPCFRLRTYNPESLETLYEIYEADFRYFGYDISFWRGRMAEC